MCNHLTSFSVLMDVSGRETPSQVKNILTIVCTSSSVVCLLLTIALFSLCRELQNRRTTILINLSLSLITVDLLVLFGLDQINHPVRQMTFVFSPINCSRLDVVQKCFSSAALLATYFLFLDADGRLSAVSNGHFSVQQYWSPSNALHVPHWLRSSHDHDGNCCSANSSQQWFDE